MIELVVGSRCTACRECVKVCPTNVFDWTEAGPVIARQSDCQTCFVCELYCRADALYVAPNSETPSPVDEASLLASGALGELRRIQGWDEWAETNPNLFWRQGELFARARGPAANGGGAGKDKARDG